MFTGFITWLNSLQSGLAQVLAVIIAIAALVFSGTLVVKAFQAAHKKSWSDLAIYVILIVIVCGQCVQYACNQHWWREPAYVVKNYSLPCWVIPARLILEIK